LGSEDFDGKMKIEVHSLTHTFSMQDISLTALSDISLSIGEGEIFTVVGPSGCGKTTLLNIIAGFIRSTSGRVLIDGKMITEPGPDRGVVFQNFVLFRWLSVLDNVAFGLKMRGMPARERYEIAEQYLNLMGLHGFKDRYPYELSGGMQQRVSIARVFANQPEILLMDEPFAALDAQTREFMQEELIQLWSKTGKTIFFITHSVDEAIFLSTRVAVMTYRPGTIKEILKIDLPSPRLDYHVRTSHKFTEFKNTIYSLVREEWVKAKKELET